MAHINTVLQSINLEGAQICVDFFQRPDMTFGFDEFRRDIEDGRGWYSIGHHGHRVFVSLKDAQQAALASVPWLELP